MADVDGGLLKQVLEPRFHLAGLGSLVASERAEIYLTILSAMASFRAEHELEPLNDDLYGRVAEVLGESYEAVVFQRDVNQLIEWGIVRDRIEKERLRGYRDNRRAKYRLSPVPQAMAFLDWIGDGLLHAEDGWDDARSHFDALIGVLNAISRNINRTSTATLTDDIAEDCVGGVLRAAAITHDIAELLTRLNLRLLRFADKLTPDEETEALLEELRTFLNRYLRQLSARRTEAMAQLTKLTAQAYQKRWSGAYQRIQQLEQRSSRLFRRIQLTDAPQTELLRLMRFYESGGQLDALCRRISKSVRDVWGRLYRELRETRRRSHRLEDLDLLVKAMAEQSDAACVTAVRELMRPLICPRDAQVWDEDTLKACPPSPPERGETKPRTRHRPTLPPKPKTTERPISSRQERLKALARWMAARGLGIGALHLAPQEVEDFHKLLELYCAGILQQGRDLRNEPFELKLVPTSGEETFTLETPEARLTLRGPASALEKISHGN